MQKPNSNSKKQPKAINLVWTAQPMVKIVQGIAIRSGQKELVDATTDWLNAANQLFFRKTKCAEAFMEEASK